jgi:hypothetical protein
MDIFELATLSLPGGHLFICKCSNGIFGAVLKLQSNQLLEAYCGALIYCSVMNVTY